MRYLVLVAVCFLLFTEYGLSEAVGKLTVDPNTPSAISTRSADAKSGSDARLKQRINYQIKQGRLHDIAADLSKITGVTISSGKSAGDWRVRDIPITVSAKNIELGELLSTIADMGHVTLLSSKRDDDSYSYRFMRTPRMEAALIEYRNALNIRKRQRFDREWAAAESLASQPERQGDDNDVLKFNNACAIGRLVQALGPTVRDSIKNGEQIVLPLENAQGTVHSALLELVATTRKRHESGYSFTGGYDPYSKASQEQMEQAEVVLYTQESSSNIYPQIYVNCPASNRRGDTVVDNLHMSIRDTLDYVKLPENTGSSPVILGIDDVGTKYTQIKWNDLKQEFLKTKVKLKTLENTEDPPTLADIALALSNASGYSIVCEDFESHRLGSRIDSFPQGEMTIQDVLRIFRWDIDYYADIDNKLIVAVSRSWIDQHIGLVPESIIRHMMYKLEGDGVDLDDATPLTTLTDEQYDGWISGSRDLSSLTLASFSPMKPLWALYDSLSPDEKMMVKTETGISLKVFDPVQLAAACGKCNVGLTDYNHDRTSRAKLLLPTDPKVLCTLFMRITGKENWVDYKLSATGGGGYCWTSNSSSVSPGQIKPPQEGMLRKTAYVMEIFGNSGGNTYFISNQGPSGFPYYSLKWKKNEGELQGTMDK